MINQCPQCKSLLVGEAKACEKCDWKATPTPSDSSTGKRQGTSSPPLPDEEPETPVVIVKTKRKRLSKPVATIQKPASPEHSDSESDQAESQPLEIDLQIEQVMNLIGEENYSAAVVQLNRAIVDAPAERLGECYALRGYVHLKSMDFLRAEQDCSEAIRRDWQDSQTYAWRAAARGEQNKWVDAYNDLDRAYEQAGIHRDQYLNLMDSYSQIASDYFRSQIKQGNESADLFFQRGWIYLISGKYDKADRDFNHALQREPEHPWASVGLAKLAIRSQESDLQRTKSLCDAGSHGDPACQRAALEIRAQIHHDLADPKNARRDIDRLLELAEDDPQQVLQCCRLRSQLGDHIQAIGDLNKLIELYPRHHAAFLVRGNCYRQIKNYPMALRDYSRYLRTNPAELTALILRAETFLANRNLEMAHRDIVEVIENDKTNFDAYLVSCKIYLQQEKFDKALAECEKAVRLNSQDPNAFAVQAKIYQGLCDFTRAIDSYSRSIELASTDEGKAESLYHRGAMFYQIEDFEKAYRDFNKSCSLRPHHSGGWIWKAAACSRMERWSDAIVGLEHAIQARPSASGQYQKLGEPVAERTIVHFTRQLQRGRKEMDTFRSRGLASQFLGKTDDAIADYTTVLNQEPENHETRIRRGQSFAQQNDHASAVEDFSRVIRQDPENHFARYCRATSLAAQNEIDKARSDLIKAIRIAPQHPRYHILLAELMQRIGDLPKMISSFNKAILQDPTDPVTYQRRGLAHMQCKQYLNAINDFTHSLELAPTHMEALVQRGYAYLKSDLASLAIADFEMALTHDDRLAKAYSGRATVLISQGKLEYALIWLTKAIHRFESPRELAEIIFARGKVYYEMNRLGPAISDFSVVTELVRDEPKTVAAARYARAIANCHAENWDYAKKEFQRLLNAPAYSRTAKNALSWLQDRDPEARPAFLSGTREFVRPTRPPAVGRGVKLTESVAKYTIEPPFDSWILRTAEKKEYGPVQLGNLKVWIEEGRVDQNMKILRADWSKWRSVGSIFTEILPFGQGADSIDEFPEIDVLGQTTKS